MKEIKAIVQPFMEEKVLGALRQLGGLPGITVSKVIGIGKVPAGSNASDDESARISLVNKTKLEIVVSDEMVDDVVDTIVGAARTGHLGDGKVFVSAVLETVQIRTGARGTEAV
ncbi:MAG: P-II family nitrogen regulator [Acidobacteriota bacterium]